MPHQPTKFSIKYGKLTKKHQIRCQMRKDGHWPNHLPCSHLIYSHSIGLSSISLIYCIYSIIFIFQFQSATLNLPHIECFPPPHNASHDIQATAIQSTIVVHYKRLWFKVTQTTEMRKARAPIQLY